MYNKTQEPWKFCFLTVPILIFRDEDKVIEKSTTSAFHNIKCIFTFIWFPTFISKIDLNVKYTYI